MLRKSGWVVVVVVRDALRFAAVSTSLAAMRDALVARAQTAQSGDAAADHAEQG